MKRERAEEQKNRRTDFNRNFVEDDTERKMLYAEPCGGSRVATPTNLAPIDCAIIVGIGIAIGTLVAQVRHAWLCYWMLQGIRGDDGRTSVAWRIGDEKGGVFEVWRALATCDALEFCDQRNFWLSVEWVWRMVVQGTGIGKCRPLGPALG
jgi:hypothetical protein